MFEQLLSFKYDLTIATTKITELDERRKEIESISLTLRRNDSSSLIIVFNDYKLRWTELFSHPDPIKIMFRGMNADGSAPEYFEGYVSEVRPSSERKNYTIEVTCLDIAPELSKPQTKNRVFKKMSRKAIIMQLANEAKCKVVLEDSSYINQTDDETTLSVNDTIMGFIANTCEDIGYRVSMKDLRTMIITPKIPLNVNATNIHSNASHDGTLLEFHPTFVAYQYTDNTTSSSKDTKGAVDPDTKSTETKKSSTDSAKTTSSSSKNTEAGNMQLTSSGVWQPVTK